MRRLLAHHIILLWLCLFPALPVLAQSNAQVMADIKFTMKDFMAELAALNEDKQFFKDNIQLVGSTYASSDYFICNGVRQTSFETWMTEYCTLHLAGLPVGHTLDILDHSIRKVSTNPNDKRYSFEAVLHRVWSQSNITQDKVTITVVWNGRQKNVSITEWNGRLSDMSTMDGPGLFELAERLMSENKISQALDVYKMSADKQYIPARLKLGKKYFQFRQYDKSYNLLALSESSADGEALYMLGWMYEYGKGISKDWTRAYEYYKKSLTLGYYQTDITLGTLKRRMRDEGMLFKGKVVDVEGKPINMASVTIRSTGKTILTDYYGEFELIGIGLGEVFIVENSAYNKKEISYSKNTPYKIVLEKQSYKKSSSVTASSETGTAVPTQHGRMDRRSSANSLGVCKGVVYKEDGNRAHFMWVEIEGTTNRVLTDYEGVFTLRGLQLGDVIVVSDLGKNPKRYRWSGEQNMKFRMGDKTVHHQQNTHPKNDTHEVKVFRSENSFPGVLYGKVRNSVTHMPVSNAVISIDGTTISVKSDIYGEFVLRGLKTGDKITVESIGYLDKHFQWDNFSPDKINYLDI